MAQTTHPLNSQFLAKFFPSATIPVTLHFSKFTDKYSPQYGRLSLSLYFMTNILFSTSLSPLPTPLSITRPIQSANQPPSLPTTPLPFSSQSPHFSSLYPKPATEHYPQSFLVRFTNNITYSASLPPLSSPSLNRTANPTHHLATILSNNLFPSRTNYSSTTTFLIFSYPNDNTF